MKYRSRASGLVRTYRVCQGHLLCKVSHSLTAITDAKKTKLERENQQTSTKKLAKSLNREI